MVRVKCIMMQKDESLLLKPWFLYYGHLFGYENLTIFDNASTDRSVIADLKLMEQAGAEVLWQYKKVGDFHGKGFHFKNLIRHWDATCRYDFALPVDCDEFLTVFDRTGLSCSREAIHGHLESLLQEKRALGMSHTFYNDPSMPGYYYYDHYPKSFLRAGTVEEIDHGFHAIRSKAAPGTRQTDFAYLHLHNKPFKHLLKHAVDKLAHWVDVNDEDALRNYNGPGVHLKKYFRMTEAEYRRQYADKTLIFLPQLHQLFAAMGISNALFPSPFVSAIPKGKIEILPAPPSPSAMRESHMFDAALYHDLHWDIRESHYPALKHYLLHGIHEGRTIVPERHPRLGPAISEAAAAH